MLFVDAMNFRSSELNSARNQEMEKKIYKVDMRLKPPVLIATLSGALLVLLSIVKSHSFLFLIVLAPFLYLALEILVREIIVDSKGITIRKLLRSKRLEWRDISNLDGVVSGSKAFLIIGSNDDRATLITNTISQFNDLVDNISGRIPAEKISESVKEIALSSQRKTWPVIQAWLVCIIFSAILVGKFLE